MLPLDRTKPALDPRIAGLVVILLGTTAMFMNKAMIAHITCVVVAVYPLTVKIYEPFVLYLFIYIAIALLTANVDRIHNTSAILVVVSPNYFAQKLVVLLMVGSFFVRMATLPYVLSAMQQMKIPDATVIPIIVALHSFPMIREDYRNLKDSPRIHKVSLPSMQFVVHPVQMVEYLSIPILMKNLRTSDELAASTLL